MYCRLTCEADVTAHANPRATTLPQHGPDPQPSSPLTSPEQHISPPPPDPDPQESPSTTQTSVVKKLSKANTGSLRKKRKNAVGPEPSNQAPIPRTVGRNLAPAFATTLATEQAAAPIVTKAVEERANMQKDRQVACLVVCSEVSILLPLSNTRAVLTR